MMHCQQEQNNKMVLQCKLVFLSFLLPLTTASTVLALTNLGPFGHQQSFGPAADRPNGVLGGQRSGAGGLRAASRERPGDGLSLCAGQRPAQFGHRSSEPPGSDCSGAPKCRLCLLWRTSDVAQSSVARIGSEHRDSSNSSPSADVACDASAGTASFGCILW
jgi:hypothetical protein